MIKSIVKSIAQCERFITSQHNNSIFQIHNLCETDILKQNKYIKFALKNKKISLLKGKKLKFAMF